MRSVEKNQHVMCKRHVKRETCVWCVKHLQNVTCMKQLNHLKHIKFAQSVKHVKRLKCVKRVKHVKGVKRVKRVLRESSEWLALSWLHADEDEHQDSHYDEEGHNLQPQRDKSARICSLYLLPHPLLRPLLSHCSVFPL